MPQKWGLRNGYPGTSPQVKAALSCALGSLRGITGQGILTGMKQLLFLTVLVVVLSAPGAEAAKPKHCVTDRELLAEQAVRHGIFLREAGTRCDDYNPGTYKLWKDFDAQFGSKLLGQTNNRLKFFQREFPDDWKRLMNYFDGRQVTYFRNFPLTLAYCDMVEELLQNNQKGGWGSFVKQAKLAQDESRMDYKLCTPPR